MVIETQACRLPPLPASFSTHRKIILLGMKRKLLFLLGVGQRGGSCDLIITLLLPSPW